MTPRSRSITLWSLAFVLTLAIAVFQRLTGPTHPLRGRSGTGETAVDFRFLRTQVEHTPLPVTVRTNARWASAMLVYRRVGTGEDWTMLPMASSPGVFAGELPGQPPAGKVEYFVSLQDEAGRVLTAPASKTVVARFKGAVPPLVLIAHILFMFTGILLVVRTGMEALRAGGTPGRLPWVTLAVIALGGFLLGPLVQKYAFGYYWTGFPLGTDLTDTKVLVAMGVWILALLLRRRSRWWLVLAAAVWLAIYLIPHSVLGSELNYRTGTLTTVNSRLLPPPRPGD